MIATILALAIAAQPVGDEDLLRQCDEAIATYQASAAIERARGDAAWRALDLVVRTSTAAPDPPPAAVAEASEPLLRWILLGAGLVIVGVIAGRIAR